MSTNIFSGKLVGELFGNICPTVEGSVILFGLGDLSPVPSQEEGWRWLGRGFGL